MDDATAPEEWRWVPGYENRYEVSSSARVRSWVPWRGLPSPRLMRPQRHKAGYFMVCLSGPGPYGGVPRFLHRIVMDTFVGPQPAGLCTRHLDGDPSNNALANLAYGTMKDNADDTKRHGNNYALNRTHCPQGHEYTPDNTYVNGGRRTCRSCTLAASKRHKQRKRAERDANKEG